METNMVEKVGIVKPIINTNEVSAVQKHVQKIENIPELLSGNNNGEQHDKPEQTEKENKGFNVFNALTLINFGFMAFSFTKCGRKFVGKIFSDGLFKVQKSSYMREMNKVLKNRAFFREIPFQQSNCPDGIVQMAKKLGIKIPAKTIQSAEDVEKYNTVLSVLADAHNKSKGRIIMPKKVSLQDLDSVSGEANRAGRMNLNRMLSGEDLEHTVCHELGHINHYKRANTDMLGTPKEALELNLDASKAEEFSKNSRLRMDIRDNISLYASTEPAEFVAETFAYLLGGVPIPKHLLQRYAQYKGMTRLPVIRDFSRLKQRETAMQQAFSLSKQCFVSSSSVDGYDIIVSIV